MPLVSRSQDAGFGSCYGLAVVTVVGVFEVLASGQLDVLASGATRRMITAATAVAVGLLGAVLGLAGALVAGLAFAHGSLSAVFGDIP